MKYLNKIREILRFDLGGNKMRNVIYLQASFAMMLVLWFGFFSAIEELENVKFTPVEYQHDQKLETLSWYNKNITIAVDVGIASWYDYDLDEAPGYSKYTSTCASRDYPKGTMLEVERLDTRQVVVCRVNDYGPKAWTGRSIDLSSFAFSQLASLKIGLIDVSIIPQ